MCGRYVREATPRQIAELFGGRLAFDPSPVKLSTYNIAPSQPAVIVREQDSRREVTLLRWGLVPRWADDPTVGNRMINARAETVATRPAYREAFRRRRCIVPATGFYEWSKAGRVKQPYLVRMADQPVFGFAGLWEHWQSPEGSELETFTIITTDASPQLRAIHDRMPVILPLDQANQWLDPHADADQLQATLEPVADGQLHITPVSRLINKPEHDTPECVEPLATNLDEASLWEATD